MNSVGQALAAQLDLDALIELVGERVRETFDADIAYVALLDQTSERIEFAYYSEGGARREDSIEYGEGLTSRILESGEPLVLNRSEQFDKLATTRVGTPSRSYLGVPIVVGDRAIGVISVQSTREVGRFGEADSGLLATIAANVSVAIQNARSSRRSAPPSSSTGASSRSCPRRLHGQARCVRCHSWHSRVHQPRVEQVFGYPRDAWLEEASPNQCSCPRIGRALSVVRSPTSKPATNAGPSSIAFARRTGEWSGSATTHGSFATSRAPRLISKVS